MSTTIDSLDIQISTSAGQSAQKIQAISDALGDLKNQGKIGAATSAMKSLAKALDVLNPALNGMNPAKLQQLRAAMNGLSNIQKASGLDSVVKQLKKIPEVLNGLDDSVLVKMEIQFKRLARAISPLATEIDKIGNGFSKLPARVTQVVNATQKMTNASKQAAAATKKYGDEIDSTSLNVMSAISNFESLVNVIKMAANAIKAAISPAMEWDSIEYQFGNAFGDQADIYYEKIGEITSALNINKQSFMEHSAMAASMLIGFGVDKSDAREMGVGYTELAYDIWAAYSNVYKTLDGADGAMAAVRSAIAGEVEPIRRAGFTIVDSQLAITAANHDIAYSSQSASEEMKSYLRYLTLVEQAQSKGIVGTYASEMKTAEGAVRSLTQSWKGFVQALGSLFIPLLQTVIPYLTAFVNLLTEAVAAIASFFGIAFFEIDWGDGGKNMAAGTEQIKENLGGGAAAAKKIHDYTMGFDELNIIQPQKDSGSGGGGGAPDTIWTGPDIKALWDDSVFAEASKQVDELKQKIKDWFGEWKTEIAIIGGALSGLGMATMLSHLGKAMRLGDDFLGVVGTIKKLASTAIVVTLQYSLMSEFLGNFLEEGSWKDYILAMIVGAIGTGILYSMWGPAGVVIGLSVTAIASFKAVFENGGITNAESATVALTGLASAVGAVALAWKKIKNTDIGAFFSLLKEGNSFTSVFAATFPKLTGFFTSIGPAIAGAAKAVVAFVSGISAPAWAIIGAVIAAIASAVVFLKNNWEEVTNAVKKFFATNILPKLQEMKKHWDKLKAILAPVGELFLWLIQPIKDLVKGFKEWWEATKPLSVIGDIFEAIGGVVVGVVGGVIMGAIEFLVSAVENAIQVVTGIFEIFSGLADFLVALFTKGDIEAAWQKIWDGIYNVVWGAVDLIISPIKNFVGGIIDWFVTLWDVLVGHSIVPDTIDAIVEWFLSLPGKIFKPVQDFVNGIIAKFKGMWTSITTWYKSSVAPKFTLSYWKGVFDKVISGASSKLGEMKGKLSEVWNGVKSWFKSNVAPKLTLTYWKEKFNNIAQGIKDKWAEARKWWNNNKPTLATVQAAIASVKDKLSSAWTTAREWWANKKANLSSVSVTVSSIKDKIVSAWNTAKEWFNKQSLKMDIKTPHFSVGWDYNIPDWQATIADFLFDKRAMPYLDVSWYAKGGMPAMGEMFIANEAGPELIGRIGSRNAVVNNDQIVAAVSEGVYAAVVSAMKATAGQGGNGQAVNVYLDGKQITSVVEQRQRERGATIMGSQVYSY